MSGSSARSSTAPGIRQRVTSAACVRHDRWDWTPRRALISVDGAPWLRALRHRWWPFLARHERTMKPQKHPSNPLVDGPNPPSALPRTWYGPRLWGPRLQVGSRLMDLSVFEEVMMGAGRGSRSQPIEQALNQWVDRLSGGRGRPAVEGGQRAGCQTRQSRRTRRRGRTSRRSRPRVRSRVTDSGSLCKESFSSVVFLQEGSQWTSPRWGRLACRAPRSTPPRPAAASRSRTRRRARSISR